MIATKGKKVRIAWAGGFGVTTLTVPGPFESMAEVRRANVRVNCHYFDRGAIRFFNSRPGRSVIAGRFFIDSRQFVSSEGKVYPRDYFIIAVKDDGQTCNVCLPPEGWNGQQRGMDGPEFTETFSSAAEAKRALRKIIGGKS